MSKRKQLRQIAEIDRLRDALLRRETVGFSQSVGGVLFLLTVKMGDALTNHDEAAALEMAEYVVCGGMAL